MTILEPIHRSQVGAFREAFSFVSLDRLPPEVLELRRRGSADENIPRNSETVMKYEKQIRIGRDRLPPELRFAERLTDVLTLNLSEFIQRSPRTVRTVRTYDAQTSGIVDHATRREQHLNLVMVVHGAGRATPLRSGRVLAVFGADGIERIEAV